jgi:transposase-like protein
MTMTDTMPDAALSGKVYCPMCTHTVDAAVVQVGRRFQVQPGQRCARCQSSLDAGYIMRAGV